MFTVAAISLLLRVVHPDQRGRATGMWQAGFLLGGMAGPALGGIVTDRSLRAPFFIYAATLVVAGTLGLLFLAHSHLRDDATDTGTEEDGGTQRLGTALRQPAYIAALVANLAIGWTLFGVRFSVVPLYVQDQLGGTASLTGAGLLVSAVAQGVFLLPAGRYADRVGRRPVLIVGSLLGGAAMLLLALVETRPSFFLAMAVYGAGAACLSVAPGAIVGDIAGARRGTLVAAFQMSSDLGAVVGPLVAGQLVDSVSYAAAFAISAGILLVTLVPALIMRETRVPSPA
jgi:MFS family permease